LREYVVSEAMNALGIPTTRALGAVTTGAPVFREETYPGAVLTRVAASHVRVGTFQYFAARSDVDALDALARHVIERHYPQARAEENPALALLDAVVRAQAALVAKWMAVGFIHGVMNTDNMSVAGETIDYGPCAFMDGYHPRTVFSSIDIAGRYAYGNQPRIAQWNLSCLASALLALIDSDEDAAVAQATEVVNRFPARFREAWIRAFGAKIGLAAPDDEDAPLIQGLLDVMAADGADFTLAFRRLCDVPGGDGGDGHGADAPFIDLFGDRAAAAGWLSQWRARLADDAWDDRARRAAMQAANPAVIPRNHRVEEVIQAALDGDLAPFERLLDVLSRPFEERAEHAAYQNPPAPDEVVRETFCGT
jgi:uncharacterized protein YdiU (UPF0061 family)